VKVPPVERRAARYWILAGTVGRITFDGACTALGVDPVCARRAILGRRCR
jgi:hypothetical protein